MLAVAALKPQMMAIDAVIKKMIVTTIVMLFSKAQELSMALYRKIAAIAAATLSTIQIDVDNIMRDLPFIYVDIYGLNIASANNLIRAAGRLRQFHGDGKKAGEG